ncbi:hypothetical protein FRC17_002772 [Serendipita sp. 399]|nr:hypothetical protein FRC17_002772 [Serendipita sp. 399]
MISQQALCLQSGLFVAVSYAIYHYLKPKPIGNIPHNPLVWSVGDFPAILKNVKNGLGIAEWLSQQALIHGPIMSIHMGPAFPKVVVSDPATVQEILNKRGEDFGFSDTQKTVFGGTMPYGMLSLPGNEMWHSHRRALNPWYAMFQHGPQTLLTQDSVNTQYLKTCSPRINDVCRQLVELWEAKERVLPPGFCFEFSEDLQLFTMDNIASFCFGEAFGGVSKAREALSTIPTLGSYDTVTRVYKFTQPDVPLHDAVRVLFDVMGEAALSPLPKLTYWIRKRQQDWKRAHKLFFDYLEPKINQARSDYVIHGESDQSTVLDVVLSREGHLGTFPDEELKDEMLNFMLYLSSYRAGQDTTSTALQWGLKLLSHHPEIQRKLRSHILERGIPDVDDIAFEDVRAENAPYLEAVVWEILRIGQVGLFISRMATRDTQILGYHIPKGTEVILHTGHVGIHDTAARFYATEHPSSPMVQSPSSPRKLWQDDGRAFDPDRWLDRHGRFEPSSSVLPFGGGNRMCFGYRFALLQMKLVLVALQRRFYFEPPTCQDLDSWKVKETVNR